MFIDFTPIDIWNKIGIFLSNIDFDIKDNYWLVCNLLDEFILELENTENTKININKKRLLDIIYNSDNPYEKIDNIVNYINILNSIGIKKIHLCDDIKMFNRLSLKTEYDKNSYNIIYNEKFITDGEFISDISCKNNIFYDNIKNVDKNNFIIKVIMERNNDGNLVITDSSIITDCFMGILPDKDTIDKIDYPGIYINTRYNEMNERQVYHKHFYYPYNINKNNKIKKLEKEKSDNEE